MQPLPVGSSPRGPLPVGSSPVEPSLGQPSPVVPSRGQPSPVAFLLLELLLLEPLQEQPSIAQRMAWPACFPPSRVSSQARRLSPRAEKPSRPLSVFWASAPSPLPSRMRSWRMNARPSRSPCVTARVSRLPGRRLPASAVSRPALWGRLRPSPCPSTGGGSWAHRSALFRRHLLCAVS